MKKSTGKYSGFEGLKKVVDKQLEQANLKKKAAETQTDQKTSQRAYQVLVSSQDNGFDLTPQRQTEEAEAADTVLAPLKIHGDDSDESTPQNKSNIKKIKITRKV